MVSLLLCCYEIPDHNGGTDLQVRSCYSFIIRNAYKTRKVNKSDYKYRFIITKPEIV